MTVLEILSLTLRPFTIPMSRPSDTGSPGVYLLVDELEIVYVGASARVAERIYQHAVDRKQPNEKLFSRVLWVALPVSVLRHYEGALIRALKTRHNRNAPRGGEYDSEILDGFGIGHLTTKNWQDHLNLLTSEINPDAVSVGTKIKTARKRAGMRQSTLTRVLGLSRQAATVWESGRGMPTAANLQRIAKVLGCSVLDLLPDEN